MTSPRDPFAALASALAHAAPRARPAICLWLPFQPSDAFARHASAQPGVAAVQHAVSDHHAVRALPSRTHVYFAGSPAKLTIPMLRAALRAEALGLTCLTPFGWIDIPLGSIRRARPAALRAHRAMAGIRSMAGAARAWLGRGLPAAGRSAGDPTGAALQAMLAARPPAPEPVARRVVLVCGNLSPGGAERQAALTSFGLGRAGLESVTLLCHVLTPGLAARPDFHRPMAAASGATVREVRRAFELSAGPAWPEPFRSLASALPGGLALDIAALHAEFVRLRPEVVHAWLDWDNVRAGLAAALAGVPRIILSGRNLNPTHFQFYQPYMDPAYRLLLSLPEVTLSNNSAAGADDYARWLGAPREGLRVVRNACAFADGRVIPQRAQARALAGLAGSGPLVGGMFRFEPEKRPLLWLRAAAEIARRRPDARFALFGQGSLEGEMTRLARRLGLGDRLRFCGVTDQAEAALAAFDVMLLCSHAEGLPNVVIESQWAGTPVVSTAVGGVGEALEDGVGGRVIASAEPAALAAAVVGYLDDPVRAAAAEAAGMAFARSRFGLERMIDETLDLYGHPR